MEHTTGNSLGQSASVLQAWDWAAATPRTKATRNRSLKCIVGYSKFVVSREDSCSRKRRASRLVRFW